MNQTSLTDLLVRALNDPVVAVRQCAALALQSHPTPEAVPDLIAALGDEDHLVVEFSAGALELIGPPAVPALIEIADRGSDKSRIAVIRALAAIADERAVPCLLEALEGEFAVRQHWAQVGLERMGVGMVYFIP